MSATRPRRALLVVMSMALAAALASAWALWQPPVRDLAGQLFRIEEYRPLGPQIWNNRWYGGHATPGYSAVFPPLAAVLGIGLTGVLAAMAAAACFAALLHGVAGPAAVAGALWFAAGTATNLLSGRVPFAVGLALGLGACAALGRDRRVLAGALAAAPCAEAASSS